MCLDHKYKTVRKDIEEGWKEFYVTGGNLYSIFRRDKVLPVGEWLNEKDYRLSEDLHKTTISTVDGDQYPMGWHVYLHRDHLVPSWLFPFRKVKVRNIKAYGVQDGVRVIVAKEIMILPKEEK